jgi:hypothetical protein
MRFNGIILINCFGWEKMKWQRIVLICVLLVCRFVVGDVASCRSDGELRNFSGSAFGAAGATAQHRAQGMCSVHATVNHVPPLPCLCISPRRRRLRVREREKERERERWLLPFAAECLFAKCIIRLVVVGCRKQASKRPVRMCSLQQQAARNSNVCAYFWPAD